MRGRSDWFCSARAWISGLAVCLAVWVLGGCYPASIETLADSELVVTRFDPGVFGEDASRPAGYRTYARPDLVVPLRPDQDDGDEPEPPEPPALNDEILAAIDVNMQGLGYTRLTGEAASEADVYVLAAVVDERWIAWSCYPGWGYWGWWGGWGPPVGPGTGWCYPGGGSVAFDVGTLLIDVLDADSVDEEAGDFLVVWSAAINGLLARTTAGIERQVERAVDRAFAQSNYLRAEGSL